MTDAHLHQSAARRMGNQGILRGWTAWVDLHEEQGAAARCWRAQGRGCCVRSSRRHWRCGGRAGRPRCVRRRRGLRRCCARRMSASAARWRAIARPGACRTGGGEGRAGAVGGDRDGRSGGRATRTARAHGGGGAHEGGGGGSRAAGEAGGGGGAAGRAPAARGGEADRPRRRRARVERVARRVGGAAATAADAGERAGARLLRPKLAASVAHLARGLGGRARAEDGRGRRPLQIRRRRRGSAAATEAEVERLRAELVRRRSARRRAQRRAAAEESRRSRRRGRRSSGAAADRSAGGGERRSGLHTCTDLQARRMGNQRGSFAAGRRARSDEEQRARRQMLASAGATAASEARGVTGAVAAGPGRPRCVRRREGAQVLRAADERKRGTVEGDAPRCAQNWRRRGPSWRGRRRPRRPQRRTIRLAHCTSAWRRRCSPAERAARELLERLEEEDERRIEHLQRRGSRSARRPSAPSRKWRGRAGGGSWRRYGRCWTPCWRRLFRRPGSGSLRARARLSHAGGGDAAEDREGGPRTPAVIMGDSEQSMSRPRNAVRSRRHRTPRSDAHRVPRRRSRSCGAAGGPPRCRGS